MTSSESFSSTSSQHERFDSHEGQQLLPLNDVLQADNAELLAQQLQAAHRLLSHRNELVDSLTDQLHTADTSLAQLQDDLDDLRHQSELQKIEIKDLRSICSDLRSLLKRQQRRPAPKPMQPHWQHGGHLFDMRLSQGKAAAQEVSLGYESHRTELLAEGAATKAPPVKAWSAQEAELIQEQVVFCQKLTTLMVSSPSPVAEMSINPSMELSSVPAYMSASAVQLPEISAS